MPQPDPAPIDLDALLAELNYLEMLSIAARALNFDHSQIDKARDAARARWAAQEMKP